MPPLSSTPSFVWQACMLEKKQAVLDQNNIAAAAILY